MKTFHLKNLLLSCVLLAFYTNSSFAQVYPIKENITKPSICLELKGKIPHKKDVPYKVELIYYNTVIDSLMVNDRKGFTFELTKNAYYTIKISREGYLPKLVSIDTHLPESRYNKGHYEFEFTTDLFKEGTTYSDAFEFPITIVYYNNKNREFYYNEKYTSNIKAEIKADTRRP